MNSESTNLKPTDKITLPHGTFLQKLLGGNYKWWFLLIYHFKLQTHYYVDTFFNVLQSQLRFASSILIWFITIRSGASLNLSQLLTYFLVGNLFAQSWSTSIVDYILRDAIKSGKLAIFLMRPSSIFLYFFFSSLGSDLFYAFWNILFLLILSIFFQSYLTLTLFTNLLFFVLLMILARFLGYFYQMIVGSVTFWTTDAGGIIRTAGFISVFCSGSLFPLDLISETQFLQFLPFAFTFYHPMQIYLGKYDNFQTILVFLCGIFWCVLLYFLAKLVFKMGLKRNESVGL